MRGALQQWTVLKHESRPVLFTIAIVLFILWALGAFVFHVGAMVYLLLVLAIIVAVYRLLTGQQVV